MYLTPSQHACMRGDLLDQPVLPSHRREEETREKQAFKREIMIRRFVVIFLNANKINYFKKHINDNIFFFVHCTMDSVGVRDGNGERLRLACEPMFRFHEFHVTSLSSMFRKHIYTREMHHENSSNAAWVIKKMRALSSHKAKSNEPETQIEWSGREGMVLWIGHASNSHLKDISIMNSLFISSPCENLHTLNTIFVTDYFP